MGYRVRFPEFIKIAQSIFFPFTFQIIGSIPLEDEESSSKVFSQKFDVYSTIPGLKPDIWPSVIMDSF
jgi:hypothetical protein